MLNLTWIVKTYHYYTDYSDGSPNLDAIYGPYTEAEAGQVALEFETRCRAERQPGFAVVDKLQEWKEWS